MPLQYLNGEFTAGYSTEVIEIIDPATEAVLDTVPSVPATLLELCRWAAVYYVVSLGLMIRSTLPAGLSDASTDLIELAATE